MILLPLVLALAASDIAPSELEARKVWFKSVIVQMALKPCQEVLPSRADEFAMHAAHWLAIHDAQIARGDASLRAEAGDEFEREAIDFAGGERQFADLLAGYGGARRIEWCEQQLQWRPD